MPYQRIMVAVDGSNTSNLALNEALYLTISLKAHLDILHILDGVPIYKITPDFEYEKYRELIKKDSLSILEKAKREAISKGCKVDTNLIEIIDANKKISEMLIEAVESNKIDLLILGTHGRRGFNRFLLGSVAEETIRISTVPVLLVRAEEGRANYLTNRNALPYQRIVIATDGSKVSDSALIQAIDLAKSLDATLSVLHIANEFPAKDFIFAKQFVHYQEAIKHHGEEILKKSIHLCHENDLRAETLLIEIIDKPEGVPDKIIESILSLKADLLIVGTHGHSGINRFLLGSVAEEIVRRSPIPVLLVRPKGNTQS